MNYRVNQSKLHGQGLFAADDIVSGGRILSERAIFSARVKANTLSATHPNAVELLPTLRELDGDEIYRLLVHARRLCGRDANKVTLDDVRNNSGEAKRILEAVFSTLSYPFIRDAMKTKILRLFDHANYLNHSCDPNAEASWREDLGKLQVHSTREIEKGEEIVISYLSHPYQRRKKRKDLLPFACACEICQEDGYETTWLSLQKNLARIAQFRARFSGADDHNVDFFAERDGTVEKAKGICAVGDEELEAVYTATADVEATMEMGPCHSSLAVAFEVRYLIHAAKNVVGKELRAEQEREDGEVKQASGKNEADDKAGGEAGNETSLEAKGEASNTVGNEASNERRPSLNRQDDGVTNITINIRQVELSSEASATTVSADSNATTLMRHLNPTTRSFALAFFAKVSQLEVQLKCLGLDDVRTRQAITHAWNMAQGDETRERYLRNGLEAMGVRIRRVWQVGADGEMRAGVEVGRMGRVGKGHVSGDAVAMRKVLDGR